MVQRRRADIEHYLADTPFPKREVREETYSLTPEYRALFEKVKDHLVRVDDDVTCKTCGKRFEIPSHRGLIFLEELEGLPKEDYDE